MTKNSNYPFNSQYVINHEPPAFKILASCIQYANDNILLCAETLFSLLCRAAQARRKNPLSFRTNSHSLQHNSIQIQNLMCTCHDHPVFIVNKKQQWFQQNLQHNFCCFQLLWLQGIVTFTHKAPSNVQKKLTVDNL